MKVALSIAGSDSCGGAGIQADLKTFQALGVYGMTAITAVTVQNTQKVYDIQPMEPSIVHDQIACLFADIEIDAVKIGMVDSVPLIEAIAKALGAVDALPPVVLDPVMISKSGYHLLRPEACQALVQNLFPLARVVTPNLVEAETLIGQPIQNLDEMQAAARQIVALGAANVVIKGGHLEGLPATDVLYDGHRFHPLTAQRIETANTHGTGCTFSAAIAAHLAQGLAFFDAATHAKHYISGAIAHALPIGHGHGPTHHFFDLYRRANQ